MTLEEGMKDFRTKITLEDKNIVIQEVKVEKTGWMGGHLHKDSYETYQIEKGKGGIVAFIDENNKGHIQELSEGKHYTIKAGFLHSLYLFEDTVIAICRYASKEEVCVINDLELSEKMDKCIEIVAPEIEKKLKYNVNHTTEIQ